MYAIPSQQYILWIINRFNIYNSFGDSGRIWTHGAFTHGSFQDCDHKPLGHTIITLINCGEAAGTRTQTTHKVGNQKIGFHSSIFNSFKPQGSDTWIQGGETIKVDNPLLNTVNLLSQDGSVIEGRYGPKNANGATYFQLETTYNALNKKQEGFFVAKIKKIG